MVFTLILIYHTIQNYSLSVGEVEVADKKNIAKSKNGIAVNENHGFISQSHNKEQDTSNNVVIILITTVCAVVSALYGILSYYK